MTEWEDEQRERLEEDIAANDDREYQRQRQENSSNSGCGGTVAILIVAITIAANIIKAVI